MDDLQISGSLVPSTEILLKKKRHENCVTRREEDSVTHRCTEQSDLLAYVCVCVSILAVFTIFRKRL